MNIAVRYYTRSGNTEKLAKAIALSVNTEAKDVSSPLNEKADILFLGCSYYAFDIDDAVKDFIRENKDKISKIAVFGTSAMMKSMKKPLIKVTERYSISVADEEFHCRGAFGPLHKNKPDSEDIKNAENFAMKVIKKYK